jgi:hypothetical protein
MGLYSDFLYAGTYAAGGDVYGFDTVLSSISVESGPSTGGQRFVLTGESFGYEGYDDTWTNATLDAAKWSDISSGSGSISVASPNLLLNTGATSGSVSGVSSVSSVSNFQFETRVSIPSVSVYPSSSVNLFTYEAYVDSSNYCSFAVTQGTSSGTTELTASVVVNGRVVDTWSSSWTTGVSVFRMLRFGTSVYFYGNGSLFFSSKRFVTTSATIRYYSANNSASYAVAGVNVLHSLLKTFVVFGEQVVFDPIIVSAYRLRGLTPPSRDGRDQLAAYSGYVDVSVVSGGTVTRPNFYEYYFEDNLVILNSPQFNVKMTIPDDTTVRTPVLESQGLGGGK